MRVSGIYKIENLLNGKVYIGQSKDLFLRYSQHFSNALIGKNNSHLYYSMNHYGINNFSFQILMMTYDLDYWERFFIYWYRSDDFEFGYNLTTGGQKGNRRKDDYHYPEEIKKKMSEKAKERWQMLDYRENILKRQHEGKWTDEGRKNRSEATKKMWENGKFKEQSRKISETMKGVKKSEETKLKMKESSRIREQKHRNDYSIYILNNGELNYNEFCRHYKNGKNDLLEEINEKRS